MVAARQFRERFSDLLTPPSSPPTQEGGAPWPTQCGLTSSGLEVLTHSVTALLEAHPDWVDAAVDFRNAFNALHRREFFSVVESSFPDLLPWVSTMYSCPTELFYRLDDSTSATIESRCGTRQGCPLGAQLFALGLHPLLCRLQALVGDRGVVISYADDLHIIAPPSVVSEALLALTATASPTTSPGSTFAPPDCRSSLFGLYLARGKTTIYGPSLSDPATRDVVASALADVVQVLGDDSIVDPAERASHMLRGDGTSARRGGHRVLGTPIGSPAFVASFAQDVVDSALRLIPVLDRLLLDPEPLAHSPSSGALAPDERSSLLRSCIHPRVRHLCHCLPPGSIDTQLRAFHSSLVDAYLRPLDLPSGTPATPHLDARLLVSLETRGGGHGLTPSASDFPDMASRHDAAYYGSWARVWYSLRRWIPPLARAPSIGSVSAAPAPPPDPMSAPPFRVALARAFDRLSAARLAAEAHPSRHLLPSSCPAPVLHTPILDGPVQQPATSPPRRPTVPILYPPSSFDSGALPHALQASIAALVSRDFLHLYASATPTGRARMLDGSSPSGPAAWLQRVPHPPDGASGRPPDMPPSPFAFFQPLDYAAALALDLLVCPPALRGERFCIHCASAGRRALHGQDGRHFVQCPHGIRLHTTVHDPTRDTLAGILTAALGPSRVVSEWTGSLRQMREWMLTHGSALPKQPDIVICDLDGPGSFTLIDIKVTDSCGPTAVSRLHSDTTRHASHSHISRQSSLDYWGSPQGTPPPGVRMRLVTFVISAAGAISPDAQGLLAAVSRCSGGSLPSSLYPLSSWSASRLIPYVRQAVTFSVRRHLAACVRDAYSSAEAAPWLSPAQDALPPVPLLDSSDALDVVVAAPPRGPPASSVAGVSGPPPVHPGPVLFHVGVAAAGPGVSV